MEVATQVLVLFLLIILGWIARKAGALDDTAIGRFSYFVLNITLPALILVSLQRAFSRELLAEAGIFLGISVCIYAAAFAVAAFYPSLIAAGKKERGVHRYAIVFSNVGYMGFPVAEAVLGKDALFYLAIFNIPFNLLAFSLGAWLISRDGNGKLRLTWRLLVTPCVLSTLAGFLFFLFSVEYPAPLARALKMTGDITSPLSMIVIGAILGRMDPRAVLGRWRAYATSVVRLVVWPAIVCGVLYFLGARGVFLALPVLVVSLPVAASIPIVATVYEGDVETASSMVFISTLACVLTIPAVALLLTRV